MSIAQQFSSACQLAQEMPGRVAEFIEIDKTLKRRFREDSMTDVLIASFLRLPGHQVSIDTPIEAKTGSDFDLFIGARGSLDLTHYRIQAKRLSDRKVWQNGRYMCIDHRVGAPKTLQADILCRSSSRGLIPLYAFYNHANVVSASKGQVDGISLADAFSVRRAVHKIVAGDTSYKCVGKLMPLFFPMSTILCSPTPGRSLATPSQSRDAAESAVTNSRNRFTLDLSDAENAEVAILADAFRARAADRAGDATREETDEVLRRIQEPTPEAERQDVLQVVQSVRDTPLVRHLPIPRPRIILIGDGIADDRTPQPHE